jgi:hypothetical protein
MQKNPSTNLTSFHDKSSEESSNRRNITHYYKDYTVKSIAKIILNGEKLKPFTLKSGIRLFNIVSLEFLFRGTRHEEEIKGIQIR